MDTNVKKLLMNNENIDVVLSSGSLMRFINFMDDTETWDLPVKIVNFANNLIIKTKSTLNFICF